MPNDTSPASPDIVLDLIEATVPAWRTLRRGLSRELKNRPGSDLVPIGLELVDKVHWERSKPAARIGQTLPKQHSRHSHNTPSRAQTVDAEQGGA